MTSTARFALNDVSVVVIVGSGAGGATLGDELAQNFLICCLNGRPAEPITTESEVLYGFPKWA